MSKRNPTRASSAAKAVSAAPRLPETVAKASPRTVARTAAPRKAATSAPKATTELPERFTFKARGASMEVVDNETGRRSPFPKASSAAVAQVLTGLFADTKAKPSKNSWAAGLPPRHTNKAIGLVMRRCTVAVNPSHPNKVLGTPKAFPDGYVVHAFAISVDGREVGHLLAHAQTRFVLVAPDLQEVQSPHKDFENAVLRVEVTAKGLRDRTALQKVG